MYILCTHNLIYILYINRYCIYIDITYTSRYYVDLYIYIISRFASILVSESGTPIHSIWRLTPWPMMRRKTSVQEGVYMRCKLQWPGVIKWDPCLGRSNLMRIYGNHERFPRKIEQCLGWCHIINDPWWGPIPSKRAWVGFLQHKKVKFLLWDDWIIYEPVCYPSTKATKMAEIRSQKVFTIWQKLCTKSLFSAEIVLGGAVKARILMILMDY